MIKQKYTSNYLHKGALISCSASILMTLFTPSVIAAEVNSAIKEKQDKEEAIEVIEVSSVRGSLESALLIKRDAPSIVDAISAKDMDALPALDLGEAMQSIPGVQLNTDDGSRNSEITLRGLPGGYAKTVAEGMSFATPSRSAGVVGSSNPFGAFEPSVFDGVTVVKAMTADLPDGGLSGVINKKLQRALGTKDGKYKLGIGGRYEELVDDWNKTINFSASKHLIKNKLAVAFKIAASEQVFRRDTTNFSSYVGMNGVENNAIDYKTFISPTDLEAYKAQYGITEPLSIIKAVGKASEVTEHSRGNRVSATGNIEWKPTESLKLGANFLYTKKNLNDSNMEDVQFSISGDDNNGLFASQRVELLGTPIRLTAEPNPNYIEGVHSPDMATIPVYAVTHTKLKNVAWSPSNRQNETTQEAKGIFLYADYVTDDWVINLAASKSSSVNNFWMAGIDLRHQNRTNKTYTDLDDGKKYFYAPTGMNAEINTGQGDLSKALTTLENFNDYFYSDFDRVGAIDSNGVPLDRVLVGEAHDLGRDAYKRFDNGWYSTNLGSFGPELDPKVNPASDAAYEALGGKDAYYAYMKDQNSDFEEGGRSLSFYINGAVERPERNYKSALADFERYTEIGNDSFLITSIKSGLSHSREYLDSVSSRIGGGAINMSRITGDDFYTGLTSDTQNEFFNGTFPGYYGSDGGWKVLNSKHLTEKLQTGYGYETCQGQPEETCTPGYLYEEDGQVVLIDDPSAMIAFDKDSGEFVKDFAIARPTNWADKIENNSTLPTYGMNANFRKNFNADQVINAIYLMANFEGELFNFSYSGNMGVRYTETTNDVIGQGFNSDGKRVAVITENDYSHTLPSFNIAVDLTDDVVLRSAYSQGLVRPNLLSQIPSPINTNTETRVNLENSKAEVLPYTADNFDFALAWYNREGSSISAGVFYKKLQGKIQTGTVCPEGEHDYPVGELIRVPDSTKSIGWYCEEIEPAPDMENTRRVSITETYNSDIPVEVMGYELSIQQKLDFLPYPFNGLGGKLNFSKVELDEGEGQKMTKIAPYTANFIGYYENDGLSLRLTYNWQDQKLLSTGGTTTFLGSDARTQTAGGRIDLSVGYKLSRNLRVSVKGYNLNNRKEYEFIGGNTSAINRIRFQGRIFSLGLSYNF
ncbi:TonB-dependent receptor domain-containing protein [Catenovulum maritimum]|uniref:Rhodanese n=1 Tax=Catenovulum maritimum TaxID=1513271 RepID=A0A0J8JQT9_9ALTE|nr:TonB-dependent receptor [Catenovulum maritimum]KMT67091.1 rhodanese [Catenovulum maritimum]